jgi:hypothetical protein
MNVSLGRFARSGIEERLGCEVAVGVHGALRHYVEMLRSGTRPPRYPRFLGERLAERPVELVELGVDPQLESVLEREAREVEGVTVEQLAAHAVLVYLADLDRACEARVRPGSRRAS